MNKTKTDTHKPTPVITVINKKDVLDVYDGMTLEQGKLIALIDMLNQALCSDTVPSTLHSYVCVMRDQCRRAQAKTSELWDVIREGDSDE